ncbi:MAG: stage III sporulation protein AC [Oscillospiraceae bacterium]|jgi:stage III sporulation protein AC|nr:stage III sporulation protein AC [Oscillospiraceae bacterium]
MGFDIVLKIAGVGLIVAVLHQILSKVGREEYAMLTVLAGVVIIIMMLLPQLTALLDSVQGLF